MQQHEKDIKKFFVIKPQIISSKGMNNIPHRVSEHQEGMPRFEFNSIIRFHRIAAATCDMTSPRRFFTQTGQAWRWKPTGCPATKSKMTTGCRGAQKIETGK
ncbi:MAG: hypothetical protein FWC49_03895 [Proteobacteria bacterium]|nr:hypothetical protein [Pseudomonadota bacterium]